jgi:hypothetical protein
LFSYTVFFCCIIFIFVFWLVSLTAYIVPMG